MRSWRGGYVVALRTVRDAAHRLGVGYSTLKQWIYRGHARSTTTAGGHHRIADAEIERLIAREGAPVPARPGRRGASSALFALSARNRLHGFVEEVRIDGLLGQIRLRIGNDRLTAVITRDAIDELKLRRGEDAIAVIKSTEVMIARAEPPVSSTRRRRPRR
jgi:molybdopterin-binding protein